MTPIYTVDAFASAPFAGNPAGVCFPDGPREDAWLQAVAAEMRHSETAFLWAEGLRWRLRWFTPHVEVTLCGHATLASAHILWETGRLAPDTAAIFETLGGTLACAREDGRIVMDFPSRAGHLVEEPKGLAAALGVTPVFVSANGLDTFVEVADEATVRDLRPDIDRLRRIPTRGIIVTAKADAGRDYDFVSRFFAPAVGVPEDPVTGSAHCALAPYWAAKLGTSTLTGYQASSRGGYVHVQVRGDRVLLSGQAVTVLRGELAV
jgi:PhzF family phenazine biosynthesis protein